MWLDSSHAENASFGESIITKFRFFVVVEGAIRAIDI